VESALSVGERLSDYSRDSPGSPETDSGSESLKVSLGSGGGGGGVNMPEAAASQDSHLSSLTNSLKDKMKIDRVKGTSSSGGSVHPGTSNRQHSNQEFSDSKKSVTVQVGEKVKVPGQSKKKGTPSANLDLPRAFLTCREEGRESRPCSGSKDFSGQEYCERWYWCPLSCILKSNHNSA